MADSRGGGGKYSIIVNEDSEVKTQPPEGNKQPATSNPSTECMDYIQTQLLHSEASAVILGILIVLGERHINELILVINKTHGGYYKIEVFGVK